MRRQWRQLLDELIVELRGIPERVELENSEARDVSERLEAFGRRCDRLERCITDHDERIRVVDAKAESALANIDVYLASED